MASRTLISRFSFFTQEGKPKAEYVIGKTVRKKNLSSTFLGNRIVLRVNIFEKLLQICKADLSFCADISIEKNLQSLSSMQASFIFYSYDGYNRDGHCDTRSDPYKCIPPKAGTNMPFTYDF